MSLPEHDIVELADYCKEQTELFDSGSKSDNRFCLELIRRMFSLDEKEARRARGAVIEQYHKLILAFTYQAETGCRNSLKKKGRDLPKRFSAEEIEYIAVNAWIRIYDYYKFVNYLRASSLAEVFGFWRTIVRNQFIDDVNGWNKLGGTEISDSDLGGPDDE